MKKYVIKVNNEYIYIINMNNLIVNTMVDIYLCPDKEFAMKFKRKYLAQSFAKLFKGEVEEA